MNLIPGVIYFVLMYQMPGQPPQYEFVEGVSAEECALLVKETVSMANERLTGVKLTGQCIVVVPQTWEIKQDAEEDEDD